MLRLASTWHWN